MSIANRISGNSFRPARGKVFVCDLDRGPQRTAAGILLPDDNMTERGIRDRWARVWAVGDEIDDLTPGQWVLVKHARWTHGIDLDLSDGSVRVWMVEYPDSVLLVADEDPRAVQPAALPAQQNRYEVVGGTDTQRPFNITSDVARRPEPQPQPWQKG